MMVRYYALMLIACLAVLPGCLPQEIVVWSPDGKMAAVRDGENLRLCDGDGKLSDVLVEGVAEAAWMPDSRQLAVVHQAKVATWEQAKSLLNAEQQAAATAQADAFLKELLAHEGELDSFQPKTTISPAGLVYLRESAREKLLAKVGQEKFDQLMQMEAGVSQLQLYDAAADSLKAGTVLVTELSSIAAVRVSSDGKLIAYSAELPEGADSSVALFLIQPHAGAQPRKVAATVLRSMDFSADGRQLVFARAAGPRKMGDNAPPAIGELVRVQLYGEDGQLASEFAEEALAMVLFNEEARIRCLKDGRILFSAAELQLPALSPVEPKPGLYVWTPGEKPALTCILAPKERQGAWPLADGFQVSPDETRVAIVYDKGLVGLLPLDGGPMHMVQEEKFPEQSPPISPCWRSQVELSFVVPKGSAHGSPERTEVVLWSPEKVRCISRDWPAMQALMPPQVTNGPETQPADAEPAEAAPAEPQAPASQPASAPAKKKLSA